MKYLQVVIFAIMMVVMTSQCKPDEDVLDPCEVEGLLPVNASFSTFDANFGWLDSTRLLEADTFLRERFVAFVAQQEDATYQWKVGSDTRVYDKKKFTLYFQNTIGTVDIQLIVESTPNLECFPDDDGIDTINKKIHFVEILDSRLFGKYRGVVGSAPNDTFVIDLQHYFQGECPNIQNLPDGCIRGSNKFLSAQIGYRNFALPEYGPWDECPQPQGWGFLGTDGVINIDYTILDNDILEIVSDTFTGKKIQ